MLKEAGVVDSGGQGLLQVMKGAFDAFLGKEVDYDSEITPAGGETKPDAELKEQVPADIRYGYCTEFLLRRSIQETELAFKAYLESIGDSIVVVSDDGIVKVHVHTNDPGLAIQKALTYGSLTRMKIDNMREEHQEKLFKEAEKKEAEQKAAKEKAEREAQQQNRKPVGFISVSIGAGIAEIFKDLGVDYLIEGGQTMNPSTEDMLNAIAKVNADTIFILPNNKNIIMAANQARDLTEDKEIIVIPTKTIPQGITAVINYVPEKSAAENEEAISEEIRHVRARTADVCGSRYAY